MQSQANQIHFEAFSHMDDLGQQQCFEQVEGSIGSWDLGDKVSWHDLGVELFEAAWK